MSTTRVTSNKTTLRRFVEATNTHDPEAISTAIDETFEPDVLTSTPMPIPAKGAQGIKHVFTTLHRAFPDLHLTIEDLIEEEAKVVSRHTITGTHRGDFMGLQPTGRSVTYNEIFIARFSRGRIAEVWGVVDALSVMRQLGAIPGGAPQATLDARHQAFSQPQPPEL